ncbi:uncharacterized protein LOC114516188 [Dendronephthya gigantea]|uniref:uncharacterized protein LOC114516188 n=1 Tax=Dendronephthya gigantea TaxID=151771 RepID=UPI0010696B36|nr:uncharacterized protein LOC114516188 [Dendronephthya gigantea]
MVQFITDVVLGYQQCLWSREWSLVEQTLLSKTSHLSWLSESDEKLDCWFARRRSDLNPPESPTTAEGFSIVTVKPQMTCRSSYKFNLPALFVQWKSILADGQNENLNFNQTIAEVLNKWSEKYPSGRIIIIGPKTKNDKDIMEENIKTLLLQLASQLIHPVYFTFIDEKHQPDQFSRLPQAGVIAFLQKLHTIHLFHKGTIYIYSSDEHYRAANSVGIRTIKATKLFKHPHLIDSIYCGEKPTTLSFLQNVVQVNCRSSSCEERQGEAVDETLVPFFSRARESTSPFVWKYCYGKVTGVCFKNKLALERYQTQYKLAAKPARPPGKTKQKTSKTIRVPSTFPRKTSPAAGTSAPRPAAVQNQSADSDAKAMVGNIDLRQVAETTGRYLGGFQCRDNVFDLNVECLERRLKITCKCSGSSKQPYDVHVILTESVGLQEARCSCPDSAGKTGRCKHVIGLLLKYKDNQPANSEPASRVESSKSSSSKNRRDTESNSTSSSGKKRNVQTLYCMSQEEFLETAKEVLRKHEQTQTQEQSLIEEPDKIDGKTDISDCQRKERSTPVDVDLEGEILKETLFSAINQSGNAHKKLCPERIPSFAEETPSDKLSGSDQGNDLVIDHTIVIPSSLVPETVTFVPETIRSVSTSSSHASCEERVEETRGRGRFEVDSFEAFLDEVI